ncbi:hypothetical protein [Streptomyces sp. ITFR-16]|uniref:hypothetical protein n=1 Tax=Streptomyces sp. ITFR-16 TaxID=3075198 RepID=UPI0028892908|nr:hypothetical protein [Streptomyces sp. ITFR-16]WNI26171.1 hypothetical protein RLT58_31745 [Streptomyces sp. ITFR-16]
MPRSSLTPLLRSLAGLLLLSLAATACSTDSAGPASGPGKDAASPSGGHERPVLAYIGPERRAVMLAEAAGRTWQAVRTGTRAPERLAWSPDGRRLAWTDSVEDDTTGRLHILDVTTGKEVSHACPCRGIGFLGTDAVSLASDGSALLTFAATGDPQRIPLVRSKGPYALLVTGGTDDVIVFTPLPEGPGVFRGQGTIDAVDRRGRLRPLLPAKSPSTLTEAWRAPDGKAVAWSDSDSGGACWTTSTLHSHSGGTGRPARLLPADTAFRQALIDDQRAITYAAWAGTGMTVTFSGLRSCNAPYPGRPVSYYVRDGKWTYLGTGLLGVGLGADGRTAQLRDDAGDDATRVPTGTLTLVSEGRRHKLADGVSTFLFTPAESAAAKPPAAVRQPPGAAVVTTTDHGKALPDSVLRLARRIEKAAAAGDTEELVRLCDGCRPGVRDWIRRAKGPSDILRAIRAHPGRNGADAVLYPGLSFCADEPGKEATCTPQQLRDVAVLGLKHESDAEFGGWTYLPSTAGIVPLTVAVEKNGEARWTGLAAG